MSWGPKPVKVAKAALELAFLTAALWLLGGYVWPTLSSVEVPTLQARLDPQLYRTDFVVQESLRFTPRFYYNELILLPARAGLPLPAAFAAWHLVALAALITGLRSMARALGAGEITSAVLVVWLLTVTAGAVGGVYFYTWAPVPAVWAGAAVAWGAALAVRRRWVAAYVCFGIAALLQFLVGFYAGLLAAPLLWRFGRRPEAWRAAAAWGMGLAMVCVPMWWSRTTGTAELDNRAFVDIYAWLRLPHHLVPSTWGWAVWLQAAVFYAGAGWVLRKTVRERPPVTAVVLRFTLGLTVAALALNWLFVEVWPVALAAKLQPARITPLAQGIFLAALATCLQDRVARRDYLGAGVLGLAPLSLFPGFLLVLFAILLPPVDRRISWQHFILAAATLLAFAPLDPTIAVRGWHYLLAAAIAGALLVPAWLNRRAAPLAAAAALAVMAAVGCARASLGPAWPPLLAQRFVVSAPPPDVPALLGARFGSWAPKGAIVLLPPEDETANFKLYAHRSVVVDSKDFPFTDHGIREWKRRMDDVLGTPLVPGFDAIAAWQRNSPERLAAVAQRYGANYVLTRDAWHPVLPGTPVDRLAGWTLWQMAPRAP